MWGKIDLDATIREYDFTKHAVREIRDTIRSDNFENMPAQSIFDCLLKRMEIVPFGMHLKRYLYLGAKLPQPFAEVDDNVYEDMIRVSFDETFTPHSFVPTKKRWTTQIREWLNAQSVRRQTLFLLGFGLHMSCQDVSDFLMKVLKEDDFNYSDPAEVIYSYCLNHSLPYAAADGLLSWFDELEPDGIQENNCCLGTADGIGLDETDPPRLETEKELKYYLKGLKQTGRVERQKNNYNVFLELFSRARETAEDLLSGDEQAEGPYTSRERAKSRISPADLEKLLCSGIPLAKNGNLEKSSVSLLNRQFSQKRMSRQRMEKLLNRKIRIDRFDLITLQFFVSSQEMSEQTEERFRNYVRTTNDILAECHMYALYPANPYEAFIMMCMLSEDPLSVYSDIWELSYPEPTDEWIS